MPTWVVTILKYFGPLLIEWLGKLFKRIYTQLKFKKKADQNVEIATRYENNPTDTNRNELP